MKQERELHDCYKLYISAQLQDCIFVCNTENPDTNKKAIARNKAFERKKAVHLIEEKM